MPQTCNTAVATRQKAVKVTRLDHARIMEEAMKRNVYEIDSNEEEEESGDKDKSGSEVESNSKDE